MKKKKFIFFSFEQLQFANAEAGLFCSSMNIAKARKQNANC